MSQMNCVLCHPPLERPQETLVWTNGMYRVLLVHDQNYPGFCRVIWQDHVKEMTDLLASHREILMRAVWQVESAIRVVMHPDKVNVASFGNQVPHLHWHIIPRYQDDEHFPEPIWANALRNSDMQRIATRQAFLPELCATIVRYLEN